MQRGRGRLALVAGVVAVAPAERLETPVEELPVEESPVGADV